MVYHRAIEPLRVLKQIATIFFATNSDRFHEANPELKAFVLDPRRTCVPPGYDFHVFWYGGGSLRQAGVTGVMNSESGRTNTLAEFVHPPFGYVLSLAGALFDGRPVRINYYFVERKSSNGLPHNSEETRGRFASAGTRPCMKIRTSPRTLWIPLGAPWAC